MLHNAKIGVLGGGQLGAMLIRSAIDFGLSVSVLDKNAEGPCGRYTNKFTIGDPLNFDDVIAFGSDLDMITIEKEAVNTSALKVLRDRGVKVFPSPEIIGSIQDKYIQKQMLQGLGVPVVPGIPVLNRADLMAHVGKLPACLKKCSDGYDGKGVMMLNEIADLENAFDVPSVLEEKVDVKSEISVIVARNESGTILCYEPVLMIFDKEKFLLDFQLCPANIDMTLLSQATDIAFKIAEGLQLVGIMAVEMFITSDGKLLVNELAPRPHNSGHHTIEACATSQYEQLLRIMLQLPLGDTSISQHSVMVNILEPAASKRDFREVLKSILCVQDVHVHWYGKQNGHEGRKMGHCTITADTIEHALSKAVMVRHMIQNIYA